MAGATVECAPFFMPGPWDVLVVPAPEYFANHWPPKGEPSAEILVYGEAHHLRSAFLRGALDYLKEPWSADELFLRATLRRPRARTWTSMGVSWHLNGTLLSAGGREAQLTPFEANLLGFLAQRQGRTVSFEALFVAIYGTQSRPSSRVLTTVAHRLRRHLAALALQEPKRMLITERGSGYRLP
jgi:DNA-binding response OmpR family regulator